MPYMLVRHPIKDFAAWKPVFDDHATFRHEMGCLGGQLFRSLDNPNDVVILFAWSTAEGMRTFASSQDLRQTMEKAGVTEAPTVLFLGEVEHVPK